MSKTSLTEGQESLLAKGPNFALAPYNIPITDYITAAESICHKLRDHDAQEPRPDINSLLRRSQAPKPNLTKQERRGFAQLKKDKHRLVLTADKVVALVIMDRKDYIQKSEVLLAQLAYRTTEWGNIQLQVSGHHLWWGVYRRKIKVTGGEVQGASQGTLSYSCTHPADRAQYHI